MKPTVQKCGKCQQVRQLKPCCFADIWVCDDCCDKDDLARRFMELMDGKYAYVEEGN